MKACLLLQVFGYGQGGAGKSTALGMRAIFAGGLFQQCITTVWQVWTTRRIVTQNNQLQGLRCAIQCNGITTGP